ncbi:DUF1573 domain-containing protein [Portibacter marinus]|uniref:DUF1573 domain-containing protein n=1 Tax=Portibacter marinus TaxID=2898660 RepID=UPI001F350DC3|nr:DUF1573 domain-containing protein [Portibacter marinus]
MKIRLFILFLGIVTGLNAQKSVDSEPPQTIQSTSFKFDKEFIDLGKVTKGDKKIFDYTMVNTGSEDIEISYLDYCACTEVDYPVGKVLKPGEKMTFDVVFDSSTKDEEETIEIAMELKNINPEDGLPYYLTLKYHFDIVK